MTIEVKNDTFVYVDSAGKVQEAVGVFMGTLSGGVFTPATALPPGRAPAAASVPTVLSTEDKLALDKAPGTYRRSAAVSATAGDGLLITGITTAGTVNITYANGGTDTINVALGTTLLPFSVIVATAGTAAGGTFKSVFFV